MSYETIFDHEEAECVIRSEASLAILIQLRDWVQREIDSKTPSLADAFANMDAACEEFPLLGWIDDFANLPEFEEGPYGFDGRDAPQDN